MSLRRFLFAAAVVAATVPVVGPSAGLASSPSPTPSAKASAMPGKAKKTAVKPKMVKATMSHCFKNCGSGNTTNGQAPSHI